MKTANITITLYDFNELSQPAKNKAIEEHRNFLLTIMSPNDFISDDPQHDTTEELQKTYDSEYDYYLNNDEPIIENIEINDYMFYVSGELANVKHYISGHGDKNGKSYYINNGIEYILN